ncbi:MULTISPECIES: aminodeoxychorismate synthase component I [Halomonas]|uniref:aminodeoxychorismate synthase n=1 Tax=Halomonas citrativorans TaxID=2742612 RepID=A0A1R4HTU9_9GAMM|nr:aminodeoxychorismate synthase component I [Halomonas citrativorans]SJN10947.1 Para-aminobenzoate synthase, aminase component [Halomonas citrativorans]
MTKALSAFTLPYSLDPLHLFNALRQRPGAVLLDSGRPAATGRYDIMSSDPLATLEVDVSGKSALTSDYLEVSALPPDDGFFQQQWLLDQLPSRISAQGLHAQHDHLPFMGGLIGYWGYDLGRQPLASTHQPNATRLPQARLGLYDWCITLDHETQQAWLIATAQRREQVLQWLSQPAVNREPFILTEPFQAELNRSEYSKRFQAVQRYIRAGDCYQINLAQRLSAAYQGDEWQAYLRLRNATPTPFSGFMAWGDQALLSLSPERFIQCRNGAVETRPIKGTRPRGATKEEDIALANQLMSSTKDRAENVMIVDLLRNDLGRVCKPGTIHVPQLCQLESYPNVHHLVSVVQGQLAPGASPLTLLAAAFPGGSITGAPKIRAMEIIAELEPCQRSAYCGSMGYVDIRGSMDTSITIRTLVADAGKLHVWGGGGLVADSALEEEYVETLDKIRHLIKALE